MTEEFDPITAIETRLANRSAEELDRERKYQEQQRQRLTVMDSRSGHAHRAIDIALHNLEQNPNDDFEYTRMAEGYYLLGDFQKAAELTRNAEKRSEYLAYANANAVKCECPVTKIGGTPISPRFVKEKFPGKDLIFCTACKEYYVAKTAR